MNTILFFDDWQIQSRRNLERIFYKPESCPGTAPVSDPNLNFSFGMNSVYHDRENALWHLWAMGGNSADLESDSALYHYQSEDGLHFPVSQAETGSSGRRVFAGEKFCAPGNVFVDEGEPDPFRRFKVLYSDPVNIDNQPAQSRLAVSPDGLNWTWDPDFIWSGPWIDTYHSMLYNPCSKKYQWMTRRISGDRRICLYQTPDWKTCETPLVVLSPDSSDPCGVEFYGMPHFYYEGYFVGLLWRMHTAYDDLFRDHRVQGRMDAELVYSINGLNWNRTDRSNFTSGVCLGDGSRPGMVVPCSMVSDDQGWLRFYCSVYEWEHGDASRIPAGQSVLKMQIVRLRKDGFCSLNSYADKGEVIFRPMVSQGGSIKVNVRTRSLGCVKAELLSLPDNKPIPGYEMDNSLPVEGNHLAAPLRWKEKTSLDELKGKAFRLRMEIDRAEIFALRHPFYQTIGGYWHKDLAGDCLQYFCGKDYYT